MCRLAKSPLVKNYEIDFNQTLTDSTIYPESTYSIDSEYILNSWRARSYKSKNKELLNFTYVCTVL